VSRIAQTAVIGLLMTACGPVQSTSLIIDAQAEIAAAKTANAQDLSPFEYVAAEAYLHKAREEQSYSDFQVSVEYAEKSLNCARVARMRAEASARESLGTTRPTRATKTKCLPGPVRTNLPPADEEPAAGYGMKLPIKAAPKAAKKDPAEPDDPPPAASPPPQNLVEEPLELPAGDAPPPEEPPLPEGDSGAGAKP